MDPFARFSIGIFVPVVLNLEVRIPAQEPPPEVWVEVEEEEEEEEGNNAFGHEGLFPDAEGGVLSNEEGGRETRWRQTVFGGWVRRGEGDDEDGDEDVRVFSARVPGEIQPPLPELEGSFSFEQDGPTGDIPHQAGEPGEGGLPRHQSEHVPQPYAGIRRVLPQAGFPGIFWPCVLRYPLEQQEQERRQEYREGEAWPFPVPPVPVMFQHFVGLEQRNWDAQQEEGNGAWEIPLRPRPQREARQPSVAVGDLEVQPLFPLSPSEEDLLRALMEDDVRLQEGVAGEFFDFDFVDVVGGDGSLRDEVRTPDVEGGSAAEAESHQATVEDEDGDEDEYIFMPVSWRRRIG